jgi:hypothetical protein
LVVIAAKDGQAIAGQAHDVEKGHLRVAFPFYTAGGTLPHKKGDIMSKLSGGCLCGAVRYTSKSEPVVTALCHCKHCQRQTGGAFSVNVAIPKGSLEYTSGKPAMFEDKGESGMPVYRYFCPACGSPIISDVAATPQLDWLKVGTLDDATWVKPQVNIWCESAQPWVEFGKDQAQFPQNPPPG